MVSFASTLQAETGVQVTVIKLLNHNMKYQSIQYVISKYNLLEHDLRYESIKTFSSKIQL